MQRLFSLSCSAMLLVALFPAPTRSQAGDTATIEEIRKALLRLPYYGAFDFLAFTYEKGVVTLMGYDYRGGLKGDAERAVKRVAAVKEVANKVEILPVSQNDDELRWRVFYAIYNDPFLSRYAPGLGTAWGHRHPPRRGMWTRFGAGSLFPGMQPVGDYPISIIVKGGRVTLLGLVDAEADKTVAGVRAREVPGSFGVDNQLMVESSK